MKQSQGIGRVRAPARPGPNATISTAFFRDQKNSLRIVPEPLTPFVVSLKQPINAYVPDMHFNSGAGSRWLDLCRWFVGVRREQTIQWRKET
jgi:hypothetical protein